MSLNNFNWDVSSGLQQGIESGGQGLAAGIEQAGANLRKMKAYRAMAVDALGIDPDQVDKMSLGQLEGTFQSVALKSSEATKQANIDRMMAETNWYHQKADEQAAEGQAWPAFAQALMEQGPGGAPAPQQQDVPGVVPDSIRQMMAMEPSAQNEPLSREQIVAAMSHMGQTNPRLASAIASKIIPEMMGEGVTPMQYSEDPVSGFRFATKGKIVQPSGVNPEKLKTASELQPMHDEENNLIGWTQTDLRGHGTFHAFKGGNKMPPAKDDAGNIIPGFYVSPEGKVVDARTGIEKLTGPKASAKSDATETPTAKPSGDRATIKDKNGKQFTVPKSQLSEALKQGYTEVK